MVSQACQKKAEKGLSLEQSKKAVAKYDGLSDLFRLFYCFISHAKYVINMFKGYYIDYNDWAASVL